MVTDERPGSWYTAVIMTNAVLFLTCHQPAVLTGRAPLVGMRVQVNDKMPGSGTVLAAVSLFIPGIQGPEMN